MSIPTCRKQDGSGHMGEFACRRQMGSVGMTVQVPSQDGRVQCYVSGDSFRGQKMVLSLWLRLLTEVRLTSVYVSAGTYRVQGRQWACECRFLQRTEMSIWLESAGAGRGKGRLCTCDFKCLLMTVWSGHLSAEEFRGLRGAVDSACRCHEGSGQMSVAMERTRSWQWTC